jgi:hypothetical protein
MSNNKQLVEKIAEKIGHDYLELRGIKDFFLEWSI